MLSVNDSIHGWSPVGDEDEDVNISQDMCFMSIKPFSTPSNTFFSPICPPLDTTPKPCPPQSQSISLAPLTGVSHSSVAPSSDRRAQRNRNRDPSWIPRPRNAFIIFRCEYSREHSQGSQHDDESESTNPTVKTLSKRAAEAWKLLLPSEKERYKVLADKEREEHARLYPHYRFRPMKRQMSGTRKTSRERSQGPRMRSVERPPAPSETHIPSVLAPAPEKPRSSGLVERAEVSAPVPQVTAIPLPEPLSYPIDPLAEVALSVDYDPLLSYTFPEANFPASSSSSPSAPVELYAPGSQCASAVSIPPDVFHCNNFASGVDLSYEDRERAQALEAYAIGLHNYDLFSPFSFPEY